MTTIVTIEACSAAQLVEKADIPLESGTLTLLKDANGTLTLKLSSLAFPLSNRPVFTHSQSPLWYFFKTPGAEGSFVRITLPPDVGIQGSPEEKLRDTFENALVEAGLLKTGVEAAGDEFGAGVKEDAQRLASYINSNVKSYVGSHPPTTDPAKFSEGTHSIADQAASGSGAAAGYAATASGAFANAVIGLGHRVVDAVNWATAPVETPDPEAKMQDDLAEAGYSLDGQLVNPEEQSKLNYSTTVGPVVDATKSIAKGISVATGVVTAAVGTGAHTVINHDYGADAAGLSRKASQTMQNVQSIGKSTLIDTSPIAIAKKAMNEEDKGASTTA